MVFCPDVNVPALDAPPAPESALDAVQRGAVMALLVEVRYRAGSVTCHDGRVVSRSNFRRDFFPGTMESALSAQSVGSRVVQSFDPRALTEYVDGERFTASRREFDARRIGGRELTPRAGRFYPRGVLAGVRGIAVSDRRPLRVIEADTARVVVDGSHPLNGASLVLGIEVLSVWRARAEVGGQCNDIAMLATLDGPGMQVRYQDRPTDFWQAEGFRREDEQYDATFYARPRLVQHLDRYCREQLETLYSGLIPGASRILDLMSSWVSHLDRIDSGCRVIGLGLNREELDANKRLCERIVHDLNREPGLPFEDGAFDVVICTASFEYLVDPRRVIAEIARVLAPGGRVIIAFSDRWFPPKAIRLWSELHPFERLGFVLECLALDGRFVEPCTFSRRGLPRPADDPHADQLTLSDPLFAVWAERAP